MKASEIAASIKPFVLRWIEQAANSGGAAPSGSVEVHALNSPAHVGTLDPAQFPNALLRDGSRSLTGNLSVGSGITIDGVDLSAFKSTYDAHLLADSHPIYPQIATAETITGLWAFNPSSGTVPFTTTKTGTVTNLRADHVNKTVTGASGISVSGLLTSGAGITISPTYNASTPANVSLTAGSAGVSDTIARSDHRHVLDQTIAPTWTGIHTHSARPVFNDGITISSARTVLWGADTNLYRGGANLLKTDDDFHVASLLGVNTDPSGAKLHVYGPTAGDVLAKFQGSAAQQLLISRHADGVTLGSSDYASQTTGYQITPPGNADFRYIFADELHVKAFIADIERALAGGQIITKSVAILNRDFTIPAVAATGFLYVQDLPGFEGAQVFVPGDICLLRVIDRSGGGLIVANAWGTVSAPSTSYVGQQEGEQRWTWTTHASTSVDVVGLEASAGLLVLDFGVSGQGYIESTTLDPAGSPYTQFVTWSGDPDTKTVKARIGNLGGITSAEFGALSGYGLYADNAYLKGAIYATSGRILDTVLIGGGSLTAQNVAGWAHGSDITKIDGGNIFTNTVTASALNVTLGGGNLIQGANFQDDAIVADTAPGGWTLVGTGTWAFRRLFEDTDGSRSGRVGTNLWYAAKTATSSDTDFTGIETSNFISVNTALPYVLSATIRRTLTGTATTTNTLLGVICYDAAGGFLANRYCTLALQNVTGGPTRYSGTIQGEGATNSTFAVGTKKVKIRYYPLFQTDGSCALMACDFQFEQGELPTAWVPGAVGSVQIDSQQIMVGTPGSSRLELTSDGLKGYSGSTLQTHLTSDGTLRVGTAGAARLDLNASGLRGYNASNVLQAYFDTDGVLKAGAGVVRLGSSGIEIDSTTAYGSTRSLKFYSGGALAGDIYVYKDTVFGPTMKMVIKPYAVDSATVHQVIIESDTVMNSAQVLGSLSVLGNITNSPEIRATRIEASSVVQFNVFNVNPGSPEEGDTYIYSSGATRQLRSYIAGAWRTINYT